MKKINSESLYELKNVSEPIVLGEKVFYLETRTDKNENKYQTTLWCLNTKSGERVLWVNEDYSPTSVELSPNHKWLSFLSSFKGDKPQIYLIPLAGGGPAPLTEEKEGVSNYHWTDNAGSIYYQTSEKHSDEAESDAGEKSKEEKSKEKSDQPKPVKIDKLQYKFDGMGMVSHDRSHCVKKVELASKQVSEVMRKDESFNVQYIAKDESYLLYFDRLDPEDEWVYGGSVYEYDIAKEESRLLTPSVPEGSFSFLEANESEDLFLFSGSDFSHAFVTLNAIYAYDRKNGELKRLSVDDKQVGDTIVADFQQNAGGFPLKWLNQDAFIYPTTEAGHSVVYKADTSGNNHKIFDQKVHLTGGDVLNEDELVVTYSDLQTPSKLARLNIETGQLNDLYNPNASFEKTHQLATVEEFWYKGADDWDIQGWYVHPVEASGKHPAIVYIHGGPQVNYGESFFHEMQGLAAEGYGVIMLNPRGGNSYGQEFVASILGDYGNKDYEDILAGTDYALEHFSNIDPDNLFVAGGSYGGFMTNWIVSHTNRFKAAVTQRSISNWISFYGTSDIGAFFVKYQLERNLSQADELWQMSPLAHANKVETPLLILHGQNDLRCPQEQAEQMYIAMKQKGVDTKLVLYPQSSHGLSRNGLPNLRVERLEEIKNWFKTYANQ